MKNKKILYILIGAVVLLLIFAVAGKKMGIVGQQKAIPVAIEKVTRKAIIETVSANGKIQPETEVKISPDVSGEVVELYVKEGEMVKKGDPLAVIRPDIYRSAVERMDASLNTSRANLANSRARLEQVKAQFINAKATHERNEALWKQKAISDAEYESSKASFEVAQADVRAAEQSVRAAEFTVNSALAALKEARDNLAKTKIFAPIAGTIYGLKIEQGERVVGTTQMAGTEMMRIANLDAMEVNVEVNENDIVRVALHDTTIIEVDAYLDQKFKGVVTEIANSANTLGLSMDQVTNFEVKIRILPVSYQELLKGRDSNYSPFRPGMTATVEIQTETERGALAIPIGAVTTRDSLEFVTGKDGKGRKSGKGGSAKTTVQAGPEVRKTCVFVFADGKAVLREVTTGIQDNTYIQIISGLKEGEEVIAAPYSAISRTLKNQAVVEKVDKDALFTATTEE